MTPWISSLKPPICFRFAPRDVFGASSRTRRTHRRHRRSVHRPGHPWHRTVDPATLLGLIQVDISGNQIWLAGKSPNIELNLGFDGKFRYKCWIFQQATFDDGRYSNQQQPRILMANLSHLFCGEAFFGGWSKSPKNCVKPSYWKWP